MLSLRLKELSIFLIILLLCIMIRLYYKASFILFYRAEGKTIYIYIYSRAGVRYSLLLFDALVFFLFRNGKKEKIS